VSAPASLVTTSSPTLTPESPVAATNATDAAAPPVASPVAEPPTAPPAALSDDATPSRPYLVLATSKTMTIGWKESSSTNEEIVEYMVLMNGKSIGTTEAPPFEVTGLQPATSYTFIVRAVDADGNKSKPSPRLIAGTAILLDDFADGDDMAVDDWKC
jgi:Fibronectin type III domain